jgi:hypothetical protein
MPTVASFNGITIKVNFRDHPPPHCHVFSAGDKAVLNLQTLQLTHGSLPPARQAGLLRWAGRRQGGLLQAWNDCQARRLPANIPYP